jgi:hypothetical protein
VSVATCQPCPNPPGHTRAASPAGRAARSAAAAATRHAARLPQPRRPERHLTSRRPAGVRAGRQRLLRRQPPGRRPHADPGPRRALPDLSCLRPEIKLVLRRSTPAPQATEPRPQMIALSSIQTLPTIASVRHLHCRPDAGRFNRAPSSLQAPMTPSDGGNAAALAWALDLLGIGPIQPARLAAGRPSALILD